jgi:hypothetical protein
MQDHDLVPHETHHEMVQSGVRFGCGIDQATRFSPYSVMGNGIIAPRFTKMVTKIIANLKVQKDLNGGDFVKITPGLREALAQANQMMAEIIHSAFAGATEGDSSLEKVSSVMDIFRRQVYQPLLAALGKPEMDKRVSGAISQARGNLSLEAAGGIVFTPSLEGIILDSVGGTDAVVIGKSKLCLIDYKTQNERAVASGEVQSLSADSWKMGMTVVAHVMKALCSKHEGEPAQLVARTEVLTELQTIFLDGLRSEYLKKVVYPFQLVDAETGTVSYAISKCPQLDGSSRSSEVPAEMRRQLTVAMGDFMSKYVQRRVIAVPRLENQTIGGLETLAQDELKNRNDARLKRKERGVKNPIVDDNAAIFANVIY